MESSFSIRDIMTFQSAVFFSCVNALLHSYTLAFSAPNNKNANEGHEDRRRCSLLFNCSSSRSILLVAKLAPDWIDVPVFQVSLT